MKNKETVQSFLNNLQMRGWYLFSKKELAENVNLNEKALNTALYRQSQKGRILKVRNGFYLVIPLEYKAIGSIPIEWFLDSLMKFHNLFYYIGLLSAAAYHGATHQAVQVCQVIADKKISDLYIGRIHVQFIQKKGLEKADVQKVKTPMGFVNFSSPEQTAFDVIQFASKCGHLDHVATVLAELSDKISSRSMEKLIPYQEKTTIQRLGYLLETLGRQDLAVPLKSYIRKVNPPYTGLRADLPKFNYPIAKDWHLYINHALEIDDL